MGKRRQSETSSQGNGEPKLKSGKESSCMICGKTFKYEHKMKVHLRIHTGETPYSCQHCDKSFSQNAALKVHIRTHTGERPFACESCDKRFSRADHLRQHIRTHTGEKPHQCSICGKAFATWSAISRHRSEHISRDNFPCPCCKKTFSRSGNLRTHLAKAHQEVLPVMESSLVPAVETNEENSQVETIEDVADLIHTLEDGGESNSVKQEDLSNLDDTGESDTHGDDELSHLRFGDDDDDDDDMNNFPHDEGYSIGPHFLANVLPFNDTESSKNVDLEL